MEDNFKKVIDLLERINVNSNNNIFSVEEMNEELDNINEISEIVNRFDTILTRTDIAISDNKNKLLEELVHLHLVIGDIEWQYDQLHEMIRKAISKVYNENK